PVAGQADRPRAGPVGVRHAARLAELEAAAHLPPGPGHVTAHLIGMLLGTEEDWRSALEQFLRRLDLKLRYGGETHELATERITIEPFSLKQPSRYALVLDRRSYWYYHPREWLKKLALVDDVYLPNNPFTFQGMEKHAGFCGAIRLGFDVPETWLLPHQVPPGHARVR